MSTIMVALSFVSPQVASLGHGLRTTLPALLIAGASILLIDRRSFIKAFFRFRIVLVLGSIFVVQVVIQFLLADQTNLQWDRYVVGPIEVLVSFWAIAALAELGDGTLDTLRFWFLITWGCSLGLGIPALFANPGIARLTMGNTVALENLAVWAPKGVGEYGVYSAFAICAGPLFGAGVPMNSTARRIGYVMLIAGVIAVLLSTFSMATIILVAGILATMLVSVVTTRGKKRVRRLLVLMGLLIGMPAIFAISSTLTQTSFVVEKVTSLATGLWTVGLEQGDETERGAWFVQEMTVFTEQPIFGHASGANPEVEEGHSSLSNSLVLFGLFGSGLWFLAMWKTFRIIRADLTQAGAVNVFLIGALLLVLAGILNPSWYSPSILISFLLLTVPARTSVSRSAYKKRMSSKSFAALVSERHSKTISPTVPTLHMRRSTDFVAGFRKGLQCEF